MVWPDEAGIGAQPARRAKAASLLIRPWCDQEMTSCACKAQKLRFACAESFRPYDRLVFFFLIHLAVRRLLRVMARGSAAARRRKRRFAERAVVGVRGFVADATSLASRAHRQEVDVSSPLAGSAPDRSCASRARAAPGA